MICDPVMLKSIRISICVCPALFITLSNRLSSPADHVTLLSKKFVDWLRYASITQGGGATSGGFFAGPRSRQASHIP